MPRLLRAALAAALASAALSAPALAGAKVEVPVTLPNDYDGLTSAEPLIAISTRTVTLPGDLGAIPVDTQFFGIATPMLSTGGMCVDWHRAILPDGSSGSIGAVSNCGPIEAFVTGAAFSIVLKPSAAE